MPDSKKINGTPFIRVQMHIASDAKPTGWYETSSRGIRKDQALEWAELQVARWNRDFPSKARRLIGVRVFAKKIYGSWIRPGSES